MPDMTTMDRDGRDALCLVQLEAPLREQAMARFAVLRPHLEDGVPLARAASDAGVAVRTTQQWLARYRARQRRALEPHLRELQHPVEGAGSFLAGDARRASLPDHSGLELRG